MRYVGKAAKEVRTRLGLTQEAVAEVLGVTVVHLSGIENDRARPSAKLLEKYHENWGVDLYVLSWCAESNIDSLPKSLQEAATKLQKAWTNEVESALSRQGK